MSIPRWLRQQDGRVTLTLHVQPGAKTTTISGTHGDALKIKLAAPPVDGKANAALIAFIADQLGIGKSAIHLKSGQTSRHKIIEITDAATDHIQRLAPKSSDTQK